MKFMIVRGSFILFVFGSGNIVRMKKLVRFMAVRLAEIIGIKLFELFIFMTLSLCL